jgi:FkbM family methyltransferase
MKLPLRSATRTIATRLRKAIFFASRHWLSRRVSPRTLTSLGAPGYGQWTLCADDRLKNSKVLLCGAGEDVSFDLALQRQFGCEVILVDPTPRAIEHFAKIHAAHKSGTRIGINNSTSRFYDLEGVDFSKIHFVPLAVWRERAKVNFWVPFNSDHVSHSITNYQGTSQHIEVDADTLDGIMQRTNTDRSDVALVKLDIEGAEYSVIDWMCNNRFLPPQILVEFDEMNFPNFHTRKRIELTVSRLLQCGYKLVYFGGLANCAFVRATSDLT